MRHCAIVNCGLQYREGKIMLDIFLFSIFDIFHHKREIYYLLQVINSPAAPYYVRKLRIFFSKNAMLNYFGSTITIILFASTHIRLFCCVNLHVNIYKYLDL